MIEENKLAMKSGDVRWHDDGKQAGRTIMRLRGEIVKYRKALEEIQCGAKTDFEVQARMIAKNALEGK